MITLISSQGDFCATADKRRGRIHRILKSFGQWMQYSVFECDLTRAQYLVLRHRLDDYIKKAEGDSARFYFLCEDCQKKVERVGGEMPNQGGTVIV
jgi:CRISPR-associated protein Cas2